MRAGCSVAARRRPTKVAGAAGSHRSTRGRRAGRLRLTPPQRQSPRGENRLAVGLKWPAHLPDRQAHCKKRTTNRQTTDRQPILPLRQENGGTHPRDREGPSSRPMLGPGASPGNPSSALARLCILGRLAADRRRTQRGVDRPSDNRS